MDKLLHESILQISRQVDMNIAYCTMFHTFQNGAGMCRTLLGPLLAD